MARIDKYDGVSGGFRAPLNAAVAAADIGKVRAVTLNGSGRVVIGGTLGAMVGVICPGKAFAAGDIIDVMTAGEIVDYNLEASPEVAKSPAPVAGSLQFAAASGVVGVTGTDQPVGTTVELSRLVVRVNARAV